MTMTEKQAAVEKEEKDVSDYLLKIMENYSDSIIIPSLHQLYPQTTIKQEQLQEEETHHYALNNPSSSSRKRPRGCNEFEILRERERRGNMNDNYQTLQSMIPTLISKAPKTTIVSESIEYIKELEGVINVLENRKKAVERREMEVFRSEDARLNVMVSGEMAFFGVFLGVGNGLVAKVLMVFEEQTVDVICANASVNGGVIKLMVTAAVHGYVDRDVIVDIIKRKILSLL